MRLRMTRFLLVTGAVLFCCVLVVPAAGWSTENHPGAVVGLWLNQAEDGYVQVYVAPDGTLSGLIAGDPADEEEFDTHNPDPKLRGRSLRGLRIMYGFRYNPDDNRWVDGSIYNPENGKTYSVWLALQPDGRLELHGYVLFSFIGRSRLWTRASPDDPGVDRSVLKPLE